jgi:hypothetical protein
VYEVLASFSLFFNLGCARVLGMHQNQHKNKFPFILELVCFTSIIMQFEDLKNSKFPIERAMNEENEDKSEFKNKRQSTS